MGKAEILEVTDASGEALAYYVTGHNSDISDGEIARTVASRTFDPLLEEEVLTGIVREWWFSLPCDCGEHGEHFAHASATTPGAIAVTAWHVDGDRWLSPAPTHPEDPTR